MATTATHAYHHGDLPAALLAAVGEIIDETGRQDVSLRETARRAGVSHSAPAHHFGDKQGMLAAFATQGFEMFGAALQAAVDGAGPAADDRLRAAGLAYIKFGETHSAHFEVMFRSGIAKGDFPACAEAAERAFGVLANAVDDLQAAGQTPDTDPRYLAALFWSMAHGITTLWVDGSLRFFFPNESLDELAERVLSIAFDELG